MMVTGLPVPISLPDYGDVLQYNVNIPAPYAYSLSASQFSGTYDGIQRVGYNVGSIAGVAGRLVAGEPYLSWTLESNYLTGGVNYMEAYLEYNSSGGTNRRPFGATVRRDTHAVQVQFNTDDFVNYATDGVTILHNLTSAGGASWSSIAGSTGKVTIGANNNVGAVTLLNGSTSNISILNNGDNQIRGVNNVNLTFYVNNLTAWYLDATTKSWCASTDGTPSIGASDANRPLAIYLSGPAITKGAIVSGYTLNDSGSVRRLTYKATTTFTWFSTAGTTADKTLCTLPAKARIVAVYADTTIKYVGGAVATCTLKLGSTVGGAQILAVHDVFTAAVTKGLADADLGSSMTRAAAIQGGFLPSFTATTTVTAEMITTGANVSALTQGSTTWYIECEVLA